MSFDETNLVPNAGLRSAAARAQRIDLGGLFDRRLRLARHGANSDAKVLLGDRIDPRAGLAHLPSGNFMAKAAWLTLALMAHNLGRAVGQLAGADLERATASNAAPYGVHHARPARAQRPTPTPTTTSELALSQHDQQRSQVHPRDPLALLNNSSHSDNQDRGKPANWQLPHARRSHRSQRAVTIAYQLTTQDRRWVWALARLALGVLRRTTSHVPPHANKAKAHHRVQAQS